MQNSMVTAHIYGTCSPASRDLYRTCTGDETRLLSTSPVTPTPGTAATTASSHSRCAGCGAGGQMVSAEKAAAICQCSRRLIYRWIEEGSLHYCELPDGTVLVCGVTLAAKLEQLEDSTGALAR